MNTFKETNPSKRTPLTKSVRKETLEELYFKQGKSLEDIARMFDCTRPMVQILMKKHGILRRKRSEARVLAIKKDKFERFEHDDINEDFFATWSPGMAWVLGLIYTDGCIHESSKTRKGVSVSSMDFDLLEKIRHLMNSRRTIRKCVQHYDKTKHIYEFYFFREKMRDDLRRLGLTGRKSLIMKFPEVPKEYIRHFIRGCWDGDGSVFISNGKLNASYVSGSKDFIEGLVAELYKVVISKQKSSRMSHRMRELKEILGVDSFKEYFPKFAQGHPLSIHKDKRSNAYTIKLNSRSNLEMLFHFFYDGVDESMYLKRKYDVFVKGLSLTEEDIRKQREAIIEAPSGPMSTRPLIEEVRKEPELTHREKIKRAVRKRKIRVLLMNNVVGTFEGSQETVPASREVVTALNTRMIAFADRQVFSPMQYFEFMGPDRKVHISNEIASFFSRSV